MPKHKSEDFKMSAIEYYLTEDVIEEAVLKQVSKIKIGVLNLNMCKIYFYLILFIK